MKLYPAPIEIPSHDPFQNALFGRQDFSNSLTAILNSAEEGLVIFVNAPWGEGKTTFIEMWRKQLEKGGFSSIYFDAYASDYFEDPFVCFTGEILEFAAQQFPTDELVKKSAKSLKKAAIEVGKCLGKVGLEVGLRYATMGALGAHVAEDLKDAVEKAAKGVADLGSELMEKRIEGYASEKKALESFKKTLQNLAEGIRAEQNFPLTIIVDELDRCRPDFALSLLERIKHLFDVKGVVFVLMFSRDQLEACVRSVYGAKVDAGNYLLKFATVFTNLPSESPTDGAGLSRGHFCEEQFNHHNLTWGPNGILFNCVANLSGHFALTLREIERLVSTLALYYSAYLSKDADPLVEVFLAVLKMRNPEIYRGLSRGTVDYLHFAEATRLTHLAENPKYPVVVNLTVQRWTYLLMSTQEFSDLGEHDQNRLHNNYNVGPSRLERRQLVPFYCERLDRFSLTSR